ncbi:MAG: glycerate kinase [Acidimicrobiales bacterium]
MRVVVAPDKFRGTATAAQAADAMAAGVRAAGHRPITMPLADGGEGLLDVLGGPNRVMSVTGPLGDDVDAAWRLDGRTAIIEMARASGLQLVGGADANDAVAASTFGTGELIAAALEAGARRVLVGAGGSATTDGGLGALRAMLSSRLRGVELVVACDVRTHFVDAAEQFAEQKGATPAQVELLRRRLERLADVYLEEYGVDVRELDGGGAAGGLAGGLATVGAHLTSGFEMVAEELGLDEALEDADLVITGEGFVDEGSFDGKVVGGVVEWATEAGVPVLVVAGEVFDHDEVRRLAGDAATVDVVDLVAEYGRERALADTAAVLETAVTDWLAGRSIPA